MGCVCNLPERALEGEREPALLLLLLFLFSSVSLISVPVSIVLQTNSNSSSALSSSLESLFGYVTGPGVVE